MLGFTAVGLLAVTLLLMYRKRIERANMLIAAVLLCSAFFCIPFFGHVFNGFSYVTNRWSWAFAALICYIVVVVLSSIKRLLPRDLILFTMAAILMAAEYLCFDELRSMMILVAVVSTIALLAIVFIMRSKINKRCFTIMLLGFCLISVAANSYSLFSPNQENYLRNYDSFNNAHELLVEESPGYQLRGIVDESFNRFDTVGMELGEVKRNSAMLLKRNGTAYYFSSTAGNIAQFNNSMQMNYSMDQSRNDLDRRSYLDQLFGVKYVIVNNGEEVFLPYGYDRLVKSGEKRSVYTTEQSTPIGVVFDHYMSEEKYDQLDAIKKQQTLMQTVIVEKDSRLSERTDFEFLDKDLDFTTISTDGVKVIKNGYVVSKADAEITIAFKPVSDCELYLVYEGLDYEEDAESAGNTSTQIDFSSSGETTTLSYKTWKDNYYCNHENFLVNVGYDEETRDSITIHFHQTGTISYKNLRLVSQPVSSLDNYVKTMFDHAIQNFTVEKDSITGTVNAEKNSLVLIQIPFSEGW